jgi:hypothetical protein
MPRRKRQNTERDAPAAPSPSVGRPRLKTGRTLPGETAAERDARLHRERYHDLSTDASSVLAQRICNPYWLIIRIIWLADGFGRYSRRRLSPVDGGPLAGSTPARTPEQAPIENYNKYIFTECALQ